MELAAARERENARLEVSRAILEKLACGRVATRLGAVLEDAREKRVRHVAFSLLSAGVYRGSVPLERVVSVGLRAIASHAYPGLDEVYVCAYSREEKEAVCDALDALEKLPVGKKNRPTTDVRIERVTIHANPLAERDVVFASPPAGAGE